MPKAVVTGGAGGHRIGIDPPADLPNSFPEKLSSPVMRKSHKKAFFRFFGLKIVVMSAIFIK